MDGSREDAMRMPPQSIPAEQAVLGGLMLAPDALWRVRDLLTEQAFYRRDHRLIYRAIVELAAKGKPADIVTLGDWLAANGLVDQIGGGYLIELAGSTPSAANIVAHAHIVAEQYRLRLIIEAGTEAVRSGFHPGGRNSIEVLAESQALFGRVLQNQPSELESPGPIIARLMEQAAELDEQPTIRGLTTGLPELDAILGGLRGGQLIIIGGRPKMGKEQPNSSLVRVPGGWHPIGQLRIGDAICSHDGGESYVQGVYPQGEKDVYTFTFADGRAVRCGLEHLWEIRHRKWSEPRVIDTAQLLVLMKSQQGRLAVRMVSGHFEPEAALPLPPWLLGFLIGDGCFRSGAMFSTADAEIVERIGGMLDDGYSLKRYGKYDYRIAAKRGQPNAYIRALQQLGLFGKLSAHKFIPETYLRGSREQRMELLRGLVDADGWVEKKGSLQIGTASPQLADDIRQLVWSLGGKCSLRVKPTSHLPSYVCTANLGPGEIPATLPRKVERMKGGRGTQQWLTIKTIHKDAAPEQCTCIRVSHPSHLYVTDNYVVTHNTSLGVNIAEHVALRLGKRVAIHSLEMQPDELLLRSVCSIGNIDANRMSHNALTAEEWASWTKVTGILRNAPLRFSRPRNVRAEQLVAQTQRDHAENPLGLVIIDYLQLMDLSGFGGNRNDAIGNATRLFKLMAGAMDVPVILLSQLSRKLEERPDKRPLLSDLRDSGNIEQDADAIVFVYRDDQYNKRSDDRGKAEIIVRAQRSGRPGTATVLADLDHYRFLPLPFDWEPPPLPPMSDSDDKPKAKRTRFRASGNAGADRAARNDD